MQNKLSLSAQIVCITFEMLRWNDAILYIYIPYNIRLLYVWRQKKKARLFLAMIDFLLRLLILHTYFLAPIRKLHAVNSVATAVRLQSSFLFRQIHRTNIYARKHSYCPVSVYTFEQAGRQSGRQAGTFCDEIRYSEMKLMCCFLFIVFILAAKCLNFFLLIYEEVA